jgi:hypothetical protein
MGTRGEDAENLKNKDIGRKLQEKSKPAPSRESEGAAHGRTPTPISYQDLSREKSAGILHKRPQICTKLRREFH